ncbi:MAG TPA: aminoacyl--tRNA ligase-related protein [Candidatus Saccharimonadales bacterium]|nr:aminoacyl--tRNA ligase-related protein [Candidatus Saccharimonadales bacterium]
MRLSQLFTKTSKTVPADESARNAQLLIQAGYISKEMAGVYSYLPLGKRVLDNIAQIVREEMNDIGGQEVQLSVLQNPEIWQKSGRWDDKVVDNWFKTKLKNGTELGIGLTHEEPLTQALGTNINSYKELPVYIYQIQTKFRNELRSKSGLLRGREFLMKDLYSYSKSQADHRKFYEKAADAYIKVYKRLGIGDITYRTYASGGIFSKFSDEFQTISDVGEDTIYVHEARRIAVNKEVLTDDVLNELKLNRNELAEKKAVEVGNIFSLGSKYADSLDVYFTDEKGQQQSVIMGSYGIGISRLMGLLAEHFADDKGLVWPVNVAPAKVYIARLGDDSATVKQADKLYDDLTNSSIEVIYDDRDLRAGNKFADADLLGIPYRVVISTTTANDNNFEYKSRSSEETHRMTFEELLKLLGRDN